MPTSCSAYNCKNRYGKLKEDGSKIQFHTFPLKKRDILIKWLAAMRRKSWQPTNFSRLCGEHFVDDDYVSSSKKYLKENAVPTKFEFPDQPKENKKQKRIKRPVLPFLNSMPSYLPIVISRIESIVCQPAEETENLNTAAIQSLADHKKYIEENAINSIDDISRHVTNFKEKKECWTMFKKDEKLAVCCMKTDGGECPSVSACLLVEQNLEFTVYLNNLKINENNLPHKGKILNKQKLENLLTWIEASKSGDENSLLDTIISLIKSIPNYKESEDLQFITEQIKLSF